MLNIFFNYVILILYLREILFKIDIKQVPAALIISRITSFGTGSALKYLKVRLAAAI